MISIKPSNKGLLRHDLGISAKTNIPAADLMKALHSKSVATRKMAGFAKASKGWSHK